VIATVDGDKIRKGYGGAGQVLFTVEGSGSTAEKGALAAAAMLLL